MVRGIAFWVLVGMTTAVQAHDFSWDTLLIAKMKLQRGFDYESHVDSYMQVFRSSAWNRYKNDEFELEDRRNETLNLMKERVDLFDLDEELTINTTFSIGKYDFGKEEFPITEATSDHYWYQSRVNAHSG